MLRETFFAPLPVADPKTIERKEFGNGNKKYYRIIGPRIKALTKFPRFPTEMNFLSLEMGTPHYPPLTRKLYLTRPADFLC
jgi:hypothetical protein